MTHDGAKRLSETVLSVPGKTFLVGEYLALSGGPSLLVATEPRFVLRVKAVAPRGRAAHPFAAASPAGRYLSRVIRDSEMFEFQDPHQGAGGLGASSAQFALLYAWQNNIDVPPTSDTLWSELLRDYRLSAWCLLFRWPEITGPGLRLAFSGAFVHTSSNRCQARNS